MWYTISILYFKMRQFKIHIIFILLIGVACNCIAQQPVKPSKFTLYAGLGPNYYLNNLVVAKDQVNELNYTFVARFMWEPEYFLSVGFETGYNKLYTMKAGVGTANEIQIVNTAVPLQGVVTMKFFQHFYGSFTMGQSILLNKVTSPTKGEESASTFSMSDFSAAIGYRKAISPKWFLGSELKGYYSGKLQDRNIGLVFMAGYRL
jgi:hypothetical protein